MTGLGDLGRGIVSDGTVKNKKAKQKQQQHQKTEIHHERAFSLINIVGVSTHTIADWKPCNKNMTSKKQSWRKEKRSEKN